MYKSLCAIVLVLALLQGFLGMMFAYEAVTYGQGFLLALLLLGSSLCTITLLILYFSKTKSTINLSEAGEATYASDYTSPERSFLSVAEYPTLGDFNLNVLSSVIQEGYILAEAGSIKYVNQALCYFMGLSSTELCGKKIEELIYPEDLALLNLTQQKNALLPQRATLRLSTVTGDYRWVICSTYLIENSEQGGLLLIFENIGPLKHTQELLEKSELQAREVIEKAPLAVASFDHFGRLRLANSLWHSLWGKITDVGTREFNILQDKFVDDQLLQEAINKAFSKTYAFIEEIELVASWGEKRFFSIIFHPLLDQNEKLLGVLMFQQDITNKKRYMSLEADLLKELSELKAKSN